MSQTKTNTESPEDSHLARPTIASAEATPPAPDLPTITSVANAAANARDAALEEAAQIVETGKDCHDLYAIAALIRARKDQP